MSWKNLKEILEELGFTKEINRLEQNKCPFCGRSVRYEEFRDKISQKEFEISGLCQKCQDRIFKEKTANRT